MDSLFDVVILLASQRSFNFIESLTLEYIHQRDAIIAMATKHVHVATRAYLRQNFIISKPGQVHSWSLSSRGEEPARIERVIMSSGQFRIWRCYEGHVIQNRGTWIQDGVASKLNLSSPNLNPQTKASCNQSLRYPRLRSYQQSR